MITMMLIGLIVSCSPQRKIDKAIQTLKKADQLDDVCAAEYPVKTEYIKGDTVTRFDTLYVDGNIFIDTVETKDTVYITRVIEKPSKTITITKIITDTLKQRDFAYENVLKDEIRKDEKEIVKLTGQVQQLTSERDSYKGKAHKRGFILWIVIICCTAWTFRKQILKLFI
jgi:hypothetical protein